MQTRSENKLKGYVNIVMMSILTLEWENQYGKAFYPKIIFQTWIKFHNIVMHLVYFDTKLIIVVIFQ